MLSPGGCKSTTPIPHVNPNRRAVVSPLFGSRLTADGRRPPLSLSLSSKGPLSPATSCLGVQVVNSCLGSWAHFRDNSEFRGRNKGEEFGTLPNSLRIRRESGGCNRETVTQYEALPAQRPVLFRSWPIPPRGTLTLDRCLLPFDLRALRAPCMGSGDLPISEHGQDTSELRVAGYELRLAVLFRFPGQSAGLTAPATGLDLQR
jgi:hypothetical protein